MSNHPKEVGDPFEQTTRCESEAIPRLVMLRSQRDRGSIDFDHDYNLLTIHGKRSALAAATDEEQG